MSKTSSNVGMGENMAGARYLRLGDMIISDMYV